MRKYVIPRKEVRIVSTGKAIPCHCEGTIFHFPSGQTLINNLGNIFYDDKSYFLTVGDSSLLFEEKIEYSIGDLYA